MKAIWYEKTGDVENIHSSHLEFADHLYLRKLKPKEVRLKFIAGSLNHLDLWILKGLPRVHYSFPHIVGADFYGEVLESKSRKFRKGDRVILYPAESSGKNSKGKPYPENLCSDFKIRGENTSGTFSEVILANEKFVFKAPKHLKPEEAAALPLVYLTAWQMIYEKAGLHSSSRLKEMKTEPILVHGAGSGVTQAILEILLSFGLKKLAVTSRSEEKLKKWKARGVEPFVLNDGSMDSIKNWAGKEKVAFIFDHIGESQFENNIRLLRTGGKFVTCGATSGFEGRIDLRHLYFRQLQLLGSTMGSLKHFEQMLAWITRKKIRPKVSATFSWEDAKGAFSLMDAAQQDGKIVLLAPAKNA